MYCAMPALFMTNPCRLSSVVCFLVTCTVQTLDVGTRAGADIEERLTLIEACVRVLPAVDPAAGSAMLMGLLSPLMHVLAEGLQSATPDETAVRNGTAFFGRMFFDKTR